MARKIKAKQILCLSTGGVSQRTIAKMREFSGHGVADVLPAAR